MAIIHNLSDPTNNLSGFDPVADYTDGTTIGRSWLLWKIFEGFSTFFPNFKKITNSSPTPTFLQGDGGTALQTEPALDRTNGADFIRVYDTNDPGLNLSPPRAIIYEWNVTSSTVNNSLIDIRILYHKEGEALYNPFNYNFSLCTADNEVNRNYYIPNFGFTTTNMIDIPKIIFWKSSNAYAMMSVNKLDGATRGFGFFFLTNLNYQGYKNNVGAITHNATDLHLSVLLTGQGLQFMEGSEKQQGTDTSNMVSENVNYITHLSSMGRTPTLLEFDSKLNVIGGNYRIGYVNLTKTKVVSDPIEGLLLCSPLAVSGPIGSIQIYNNKYYLLMGNINDGANTHRVLLELGSVTP